jgi:hypothetical protein
MRMTDFYPVVPAKAGIHSHRAKFGEDPSFGTTTEYYR